MGETKTIGVPLQSNAVAEITVVTVQDGSETPLSGASVEIEGINQEIGSGETHDSGKWWPARKGDATFARRPFPAGSYSVRVQATDFGPYTGPVPVQDAGVFRARVSFEPDSKRPADPTNPRQIVPNQLLVRLALRNPIIIVTVRNVNSPLAPAAMQGVAVEIEGVPPGRTDSLGQYRSPPLPYGRRRVRVRHDGFFPQAMPGTEFVRIVELNPVGFFFDANERQTRDLELTVDLATFPPSNLPSTHPHPLALWLSGFAVSFPVAEDPRLPTDGPEGQSAWDVGIRFAPSITPTGGPDHHCFDNLVASLTGAGSTYRLPGHLGPSAGQPIGLGQIRRLAISGHGAPGTVDVDQLLVAGAWAQSDPKADWSLTLERIPEYLDSLRAIGTLLARDSVVYLISCQAGDGAIGERLLKELSKIWPTSRVVGFRTLMFSSSSRQQRAGASYAGTAGGCNAGARETPFHDRANAQAYTADTANWSDLGRLPWGSEVSPYATVAQDGNIIRRGGS